MKKESPKLQISSFNGRVPAELSADFILPDIYPDVKRILRVTATPMILHHYITGRQLEINGAVDYILLFSADTDSGEVLQSVHFAGDFACSVSDSDELEDAELLFAPQTSVCTARLVNPRKISLKSTVFTDVRIARMKTCEPLSDCSAKEAAHLERLIEASPTLRERSISIEAKRISENLEPDASQPAIDEIVLCHAALHFHEARPTLSNGVLTVSVKGEALVSCLYKAVDHSWRSFQRKLPLAYTLNDENGAAFFDGCQGESLTCDATASVSELNAAAGENSYGERRVLEFDLTYEPKLHMSGVVEVPLTLDAYSTENAADLTRCEMEYCRSAKQISANFSIGESTALEELHIPEGSTLFDAEGTVSFHHVTLERSRAVVSGKASLSCLYMTPEGTILAAEPSYPIRCELAAGELREPLTLDAHGVISDLRVRLADRLYADFEVSLCAQLRECARQTVIREVKIGAPLEKSHADSNLILCYPATGETMWSIAKRYHVSADALQAANRDSDHVVMIPQHCGISGVI